MAVLSTKYISFLLGRQFCFCDDVVRTMLCQPFVVICNFSLVGLTLTIEPGIFM